MRAVAQSPSPAALGGGINPPILVYDTSGPYTDPNINIDINRGLMPMRKTWIEARGSTETLTQQNGFCESKQHSNQAWLHPGSQRLVRRAIKGANITQLHLARKGVITPEMEFVAIRESMQREQMKATGTLDGRLGQKQRDRLMRQHQGQGFGANIPNAITPEFVRNEIACGRAIIPCNVNHPESEPMIIGTGTDRNSAHLSSTGKSGRPSRGHHLGHFSRHPD